ncbi:MAG TPA: outer membrane protein transport protein, partial [Vicinamibacteria bacterium]|nr:outer membrane protein transport protein [Vicinamibacteria bacterium]
VATIEGHDWAWGWNVGATVKVGEPGRLAVAYRSRVSHELEGDATFSSAPSFSLPGPLAPLGGALNARFASGPVTAKVELPDTVSVAAAYEGDRVGVLADWSWTGWSSIESLPIERVDGPAVSEVPLRFDDVWRVGLGVNYKTSDRLKLRFGTAYDVTPVQDAFRTPRLPDQSRIWAAAGFQYRVGKGAIDVGYAHLFVEDASSNLPNQDTPTAAPAGTLVGTYEGKVDIFSVQYRLSF